MAKRKQEESQLTKLRRELAGWEDKLTKYRYDELTKDPAQTAYIRRNIDRVKGAISKLTTI